jgi:hypothetical protein
MSAAVAAISEVINSKRLLKLLIREAVALFYEATLTLVERRLICG